MLAHVIACPLCHQSLQPQGHFWGCQQGHHFDLSRFGYLNLLPAQHKKSKSPGDSQEMVDARTRLLNSAIYQPISDLINQWLLDLALAQPRALQIADVGCGEGYYTQRLKHSLDDHRIEHCLYGVDIAKEALRRAAKRHSAIHWLVASGGKLPFLPQSLDISLNLFTNPMPQGLAQALAPQGIAILVNTGPRHLWELRERIYDEVHAQHFDPSEGMLQQGFGLEAQQQLSYRTKLYGAKQIMDLLMMTPHRFKVHPSKLEALQQLDELEISIDIVLQQYRKGLA